MCWRRCSTARRETSAQSFPIGSAKECTAKLLAYGCAGAQRIFLWPLADERSQLELFRESVIPLLEAESA